MGSTTLDAAAVAKLVQQLKSLKASDIPDEISRKDLFDATRNLAFSLESAGDSIQRIAYVVWPHRQACRPKLKADCHALYSHSRLPPPRSPVTLRYSNY